MYLIILNLAYGGQGVVTREMISGDFKNIRKFRNQMVRYVDSLMEEYSEGNISDCEEEVFSNWLISETIYKIEYYKINHKDGGTMLYGYLVHDKEYDSYFKKAVPIKWMSDEVEEIEEIYSVSSIELDKVITRGLDIPDCPIEYYDILITKV